MRIAFMGTPDFAVPTLERLVADGHEVAAVYTQQPRRAGRGKAMTPTAVQRSAEALGLSVHSPTSLRGNAEQDAFRVLNLDAAVVAAYGLILPAAILEAPRLGCFNVHASLLPRWRGAAPVQRAILAGDTETGVTIMAMEPGLDTGPMLLVRRTDIASKNAGDLLTELGAIGADAMAAFISRPAQFSADAQPNDGVTYASKIEKHEARLDFTQGAEDVLRQIRAFSPAPGAFFEYAGERIRVLAADLRDGKGLAGNVIDDDLTIACEASAIRPTRVQRAGRGVMDTSELLRGFAIPRGSRLT